MSKLIQSGTNTLGPIDLLTFRFPFSPGSALPFQLRKDNEIRTSRVNDEPRSGPMGKNPYNLMIMIRIYANHVGT